MSWAEIVKGVVQQLPWEDVVQNTFANRSWADIVDEEQNAEEQNADEQNAIEDEQNSDEQNADEQNAIEDAFEDEKCIESGTFIGIRMIQSILMSATQMNLSHFHTAGMGTSKSSYTMPSIADAMNSKYTKKNTSMVFDIESDISSVRGSIVGKDLNYFVDTIGSSFSLFPDRENIWYKVLGKPVMSEHSDKVLRFYINYNKLKEFGLTLNELASRTFGDECTIEVSPDFMGMIDIEMPNSYISPWLSKIDKQVCGTTEILSCNEAGIFEGSSCNEAPTGVITEGSNILVVSRTKGVIKSTIKSNNVNDVEKCYGIEAAASVLTDLTTSHIVSDFMTRTGKVLPFSKTSIEVMRKGMLTSMGFERPKNDIKTAIASGKAQTSESVYNSIMIGVNHNPGFDIPKRKKKV